MEYLKLNKFIKTKRKSLGLTQEDLSFKAGVGLRFIRELERGKPTLQMDKVNQVLKLFGCELGATKLDRNGLINEARKYKTETYTIEWKAKMKIKIKKTTQTAKFPTRKDGDIGWDLYADSVEQIADNMVKIHSGIAMELPSGYWGQIENRSSMGKNGYAVHGGIIDNHYRGEIMIIAVQHKVGEKAIIEPGQKIAQLIVRKQEDSGWEIEELEKLSETERGAGGFGSTGK